MLMDNLRLTKEVSDTEGYSLMFGLNTYGDLGQLLRVEIELGGDRIFRSVDTSPEQLEELADTFRDWAEQLRRYQSQMLTNNLFEGD